MALTPIGPFCPFRSSAASAIEPRMEKLKTAGPELAAEMSRLTLDLQMGNMPEAERLARAAKSIDAAVDDWESLITRLKLSQDFQTLEYAKLTQAHLESQGVTVSSVASMMRWQANCMRAMGNQSPPPMPPPDFDLERMMQETDATKEKPSIASMMNTSPAQLITETPFHGQEDILRSENVKAEYEAICRDHLNLIEFGGKYESFDPMGKIIFLEQIESIEERWDVFYARFSLMGALNKRYVLQCNEFLAGMGLTEGDFRVLLRRCHQMMKQEAEAERNLMGSSF
jgi:hypothetical protein